MPSRLGEESRRHLRRPRQGDLSADGADRRGELARAAVREIVARHRRHDGIGQPEPPNGLGDRRRLVRVGRPGLPLGDRAEAAAARADLPEDQEGRRPRTEALAAVRAARRLADRRQAQLAHQPAHLVPPGEVVRFREHPGRLAHGRHRPPRTRVSMSTGSRVTGGGGAVPCGRQLRARPQHDRPAAPRHARTVMVDRGVSRPSDSEAAGAFRGKMREDAGKPGVLTGAVPAGNAGSLFEPQASYETASHRAAHPGRRRRRTTEGTPPPPRARERALLRFRLFP